MITLFSIESRYDEACRSLWARFCARPRTSWNDQHVASRTFHRSGSFHTPELSIGPRVSAGPASTGPHRGLEYVSHHPARTSWHHILSTKLHQGAPAPRSRISNTRRDRSDPVSRNVRPYISSAEARGRSCLDTHSGGCCAARRRSIQVTAACVLAVDSAVTGCGTAGEINSHGSRYRAGVSREGGAEEISSR
jgi:hypothetical protein